MKYLMIPLVLALILILNSSQSNAGWLVYNKPEFKGRVLDVETKEPIEGAVVVVSYSKYTIGPVGRDISLIKAIETLTDKNGEFHFPSYTTLIQPFSGEDKAEFIIYKPGYGSFPNYQITPSKGITDQELFFSKEIGSTGELEMWVKDEKGLQIKKSKVSFGIVELPKLKTKEERLKAQVTPSGGGHLKPKDLPHLYKAFNEDRRKFGLDEYKLE